MNNTDNALLNPTQKTRIYGLDIWRIIAMFMIVFLHVSGHGGIPNQLRESAPLSINYYISTFLHYFSNVGVNIFVLLTGYLYADRKLKIANLLNIVYAVIFYSMAFWIFQKIMHPGGANLKMLLQGLSGYWFVNVYIALFCFIPFFNLLINNRKMSCYFIFTGLLLFSIIPTFTRLDLFGSNGGFSLLWFSVLYMSGAFFRKYKLENNFRYWRIYFFSLLFSVACKFVIEEIIFAMKGKYVIAGGYFYSYNSPLNYLQALCLVMIFSKIKEVPSWLQKIVAWGSPLMIGIYLVHDNAFFRSEYIINKFSFIRISSRLNN